MQRFARCAILFACLFAFSDRASAQIVDARYPSYGNRMTGDQLRKLTPRRVAKMRRTIWQGFRAEIGSAITLAGRPSGCPSRAWCGCWLSVHLGLYRRDLWLARNWTRVGSSTHARPGAIAVWRHHVGKVTAVNGSMILLLSGNDGRRVRERWRSARGVIAYRAI